MGYVTPEQITQAKELDLLTYLQRYDPHVPQAQPKKQELRVLSLPQPSRCATHAVSYLHGRGIVGDFKGEAPGSDKRYSFCIAENPNANSVHLFESAIDLLNYTTLLKMEGRNCRQDALLSLGGVFKRKQEFVIPLALCQYLKDHSGIKTLCLPPGQ